MRASDRSKNAEPVQENMRLQIWLWRFERWGWFVLLLIVLLAFTGVFSNGPLSDLKAVSAQGKLVVEYPRFVRNGSQAELVIKLQEVLPDSQILITGELLEGFSIESIYPVPLRSGNTEDGGVFLAVKPENGVVRLSISMRSNSVGRFNSSFHVGDQAVKISQMIYP